MDLVVVDDRVLCCALSKRIERGGQPRWASIADWRVRETPGWYLHRMPEDPADHFAQRVTAAERRLATIAPGFLEQVRDAAGRLAPRYLDGSDARAALATVEDLALIDLDAPTGSRLPLVPLLKKAIKRLIIWYLSYLGRQLSGFGQAVAHLGGILVDRTERLEGITGSLQGDVARLADRVAQLEEGPRRPT
jgi:hypothetical protein